jgi:hypothetical protein
MLPFLLADRDPVPAGSHFPDYVNGRRIVDLPDRG